MFIGLSKNQRFKEHLEIDFFLYLSLQEFTISTIIKMKNNLLIQMFLSHRFKSFKISQKKMKQKTTKMIRKIKKILKMKINFKMGFPWIMIVNKKIIANKNQYKRK